jgi:hypothetical protein
VAQVLGVAPVLLGCSVLAGASYLALALGSSALAFVFYLGFMTVRGLQGPLLAGALQADAPPEDRASVLSLNALLFRLTSAIVLPSVGALADRIGIEPTLGVLAALSLAVCLAAWSAFARAQELRSVHFDAQLLHFAFAANLAQVGLHLDLQIFAGRPAGAVLGEMPDGAAGGLTVNRLVFFAQIDAPQIALVAAAGAGADVKLRAAVRTKGYERRREDIIEFQMAQRELLPAMVATNGNRPLGASGHRSFSSAAPRPLPRAAGRAAPARCSRSAPRGL